MDNLLRYNGSVLLYAACITISVVFACLAQIFYRIKLTNTGSLSYRQAGLPNRVWWLFSMLVPFLVSALRWNTGTDYANYLFLYTSFNKINSIAVFVSRIGEAEPAYILLNFLAKALFDQAQMIFVISAAVTFFCFYSAMLNYHEKCSVALMVLVYLAFFYAQSMNIIRQMMAVSIVFLSYQYLFRRRYGTVFLLIALAASFHVTALLVIPFCFLYGDKRWQKVAIRLLFICSLVLLFLLVQMPSIFNGIPLLGSINSGNNRSQLGLGLLVLRAPMFIPPLIFRKWLIAHDEKNKFWLILLVFEVVFSYYGYMSDEFNRLALYFSPSWIVLLPSLVRSMPSRNVQRIMGVYVILVTLFFWVFNVVYHNYGETLPYESIFMR